MNKFLRIILLIVGCLILVELNSGTFISDIKGVFHKNINYLKDVTDSSYYSDTTPPDYNKLLHYAGHENLLFVETSKSKFRNPVSSFVYKQNFYLQVYKMDSLYNSSVKDNIKEEYVNAKQSFYVPYTLNERSEVEYLYKLSAPAKPTTIYLRLLGKNNQIILKNDSVADYYSVFENFSIRYKASAKNDIYGETKDNGLFSNTLLPIEILFIKRDNSLYLLTMSAYKETKNFKFTPGMLYNLVKNEK